MGMVPPDKSWKTNVAVGCGVDRITSLYRRP